MLGASLLTDCQNVLLRKSQNNFRLIQIFPCSQNFAMFHNENYVKCPLQLEKKCPLYRIQRCPHQLNIIKSKIFWDWPKVPSLQRCPLYGGAHQRRFHCTCKQYLNTMVFYSKAKKWCSHGRTSRTISVAPAISRKYQQLLIYSSVAYFGEHVRH